jgi:hypothetical protein
MFSFTRISQTLKAQHKKLVILKFSLARFIYTSTPQPAYYFLKIQTQFTTKSSILCCQYCLWQETDWCSWVTLALCMADSVLKIRSLSSGIQVSSATMLPLPQA